jgi:STE24 endopeptidase
MPTLPLLLAWLIGLGIPPNSGRPASWILPSSLGVLAGLLCGQAMLAVVFSRDVLRRARQHGWLDEGTRRAYVRGARLLDFIGLGAYAWFLHGFGFLSAVSAQSIAFPAVRELLALAPYALIQIATWVGTWPADRSLLIVSGGITRRASILRRLRQGWGLILPIFILMVTGQWVLDRLIPGWSLEPWLQFAFASAFAVCMLILAPLLLRLSMPTRPLERGPLRERLLGLAKQLRFEVREIRVWDTGHSIANAAITGVLPCLREVLISDVLVDQIGDKSLEYIFAHEVGHAKHRHIVDMAIFVAGSLALIILGIRFLEWLAPGRLEFEPPWMLELVMISLFVIYVGICLGFLSRRFERQADLFGCRAIGLLEGSHGTGDMELTLPAVLRARLTESSVETFSRTLLSVSAINGIDPELGTLRGGSLRERVRSWVELARTWRHGSVMGRVEFLLHQLRHPRATDEFERGLRSLRLGVIALSLAACTLVLWLGMPSWR